MNVIDSHAHLTDERFSGEVDAVLERARAAGVVGVVSIGTTPETSAAAVRLATELPDVWASVGIHPHSVAGADEAAYAAIEALAARPRVVAVGETGLDYHYDFAPRDVQRRSFAWHLDLGRRLGLPVVVHARSADEDVAEMILAEGKGTRGVLHCFAGDRALLEAGLRAGWHISFSGLITFAKYDGADLVRAVPRERILVETDSPYLAPVPYRGKRNEPGYVPLVARRAAELRGEDPVEFAAAVLENTREFFRIQDSGFGENA